MYEDADERLLSTPASLPPLPHASASTESAKQARLVAWTSSLDQPSQETYRAAEFMNGNKSFKDEQSTRLLMPKITEASEVVTHNLTKMHATSLTASNPDAMLTGLVLEGEYLLIPVVDSLTYGMVTITAHPLQTTVDTFQSGIVVLTSKRVILVSAQQYQKHSLTHATDGSYLLESVIRGNAEVYPIPRSAVTGAHFRMVDSTVVRQPLLPIAREDDCCWNCWGRSPQDYREGRTENSHGNSRKLILDLNLSPFGQCRMSIEFVSLNSASSVALAKRYVHELGKTVTQPVPEAAL